MPKLLTQVLLLRPQSGRILIGMVAGFTSERWPASGWNARPDNVGIRSLALSGAYMIIESWLNERVDNDNRGALFAGYMIASMCGVGAGQFILPLGHVVVPTLFMIGALIYSLAMLPIAFTTSPQPLTPVTLDLKTLYLKSPAGLVGSLLAGVIFGNWNYFGPLYGQNVG